MSTGGFEQAELSLSLPDRVSQSDIETLHLPKVISTYCHFRSDCSVWKELFYIKVTISIFYNNFSKKITNFDDLSTSQFWTEGGEDFGAVTTTPSADANATMMQFSGTGVESGLNSTENPLQGKWLYLRRFLKVRRSMALTLFCRLVSWAPLHHHWRHRTCAFYANTGCPIFLRTWVEVILVLNVPLSAWTDGNSAEAAGLLPGGIDNQTL